MTILWFLVHLMGATMLLLYAVRMVRTGIERAFGASFRRLVTRAGSPLGSAATGLTLAMVLQSSAAVSLLVAGFVGTGALGFAPGLAVMLGADLGSALLIQILSFDLEWLVPFLLALGGGFFIKSDGRKLKQAGRIILGIAFILISLRFLRETMDPIRDSAFLPSLAGFLERDFVTAFIVGTVLAWLMHSSVAVILMCVTLVAIDAVPVMAGVSLVLGANLGSALIPFWLTRNMGPQARHVPLANFMIRGSGALVALVIVNKTTLLTHMPGEGGAQALIYTHLAFNALLLVLLPFCRLFEPLTEAFFPASSLPDEEMPQLHRSVLDPSSLQSPSLAIANLRREVLRMSQVVEGMCAPIMDFFVDYDKDRAEILRARDDVVNQALDDIRRFVADIPLESATKQDKKRARDLTEYAIAIETVGDLLVKLLLPLAREKSQSGLQFSEAGHNELISMHEQVMANIGLASNVLISEDLESARLLLEEKAEMTRLERWGRKKHLKRLVAGQQTSFDSSDIHLEILRGLREINSHVASVCYPILYRGGQLLETRLIETMSDDPEDLSDP